MKKYLLVSFLLSFIVVLSACGEGIKEKFAEFRNSTAELIAVNEEENLDETEDVQDEDQLEDENLDETDGDKKDTYVSLTEEGENRMVAAAFEGGDVQYTEMQRVDTRDFLTPRKSEIMALAYDYYTFEDVVSLIKINKVGEIIKGKYAGYDLLTLISEAEGPSFSVWIYRLGYNPENGDLVYFDDGQDSFVPYFIEGLNPEMDVLTTLKGANMPEYISIPETEESLQLEVLNYIEANNVGDLSLEFSDEVYGDVYSMWEANGCFYVKTPDGLYAQYSYNPGFVDGPTSKRTLKRASGESIQIGEKYKFLEGGCGSGRVCYYVLDDVDESNLRYYGASLAGVKFYTVKEALETDMDNPGLSDEREQVANFYDISRSAYEADGVSFADYLADNSALFWQDPFGRWVGLYDLNYAPLAECGKPVVYLYPEQEQEVSVKVLLDELTVSIPEHGKDGWTVMASSSGEIKNLADGQEYPYLFWEGKKEIENGISKGFVVQRYGLKFFLESSLTKLGLNETERADFMEFWYPLMLEDEKPYYFVSFIGTNDFNKIAPLEIKPAPDTLIRVFMYYEGLNEKMDVQPQVLNSIEREGFTVIEWGGNLRK